MNVLLQGDVGSGKTLVALHAALVAIDSGHQAAIMAPTEVLAGQHFRQVEALLGASGAVPYLELASAPSPDGAQASLLDPGPSEEEGPPRVTYALLTAAVTGKDRARILDGIASGDVDLVVGTHALVQEGVSFADLSLAVIDEQHRFGVHQRMALKGKGASPDVLIMTATPIPRTLALTYYGDLDVVVLDEMPKGRQPIRTRIARTQPQRQAAYELVRAEVEAGRQAFVVCAAIDETNRNQVRAAESEAQRLATDVFPDLSVEVLHGRLRPAEKERVMEGFRSGRTHLLISTTVIEVGVDVPNATVMLVENAERFGLAQLHQLRGRIGRGTHPSTCVLFDESEQDNLEARARLEAMVRTTDGFELADEDLRLRGEGTLFDVQAVGAAGPQARATGRGPRPGEASPEPSVRHDRPRPRPGRGAGPAGRAPIQVRGLDRLAVPLVRVIAGSAKGVRLGPVPRGVRPVSDMAREGVFSSLGPDVAGARVLDLYAGTGAMAIEALSRGAEHATLVERDRAALGAIRDNLARARVAEAADVVASDVLSFLTRDDNPLGGIDLVFADPPYAMEQEDLDALVAAIGAAGLSGPAWRVVLTRPKRSSTPVIPLHWLAARRLSYGDTLVFIFREV